MLNATTKQRFEDALSSGKLRELAAEMTAEGLSQVAILCLFESFYDSLGAEREADQDCISDCLDCIFGCACERNWFPGHTLSSPEIDEYRKTIS